MDSSLTVLDAMILTGYRGNKIGWNFRFAERVDSIIKVLEAERIDFFSRIYGRKKDFVHFVKGI